MYDENDFTPHLGQPRARSGGRPRTFLQRVLRVRALAGAARRGSRRFSGSRIGRGSVVARQLASGGRFAGHRQRRVMVKYRIAHLNKPNGTGAARAHLRYIQRDGVTRDGEPGRLYSADADRLDGKAFRERCDSDRHQFRFIVSPEDGQQYDDLKSLTRRLMAQMERDLGTTLDWVAVDHFNTGHPHTHIVVRGIDDHGGDLVIDGEYLTGGLRQRARELVSIDLGPRTEVEVADTLRHEIEQERLTSIDRRLLRDAGDDRIVVAADDPFHQSLRAGRLQKLGHLGLADEIEPGRWRLAEDMDAILKRMGERGDIIRTMQRAFAAHGLERVVTDYAIADPVAMMPIVGRVVERGLSDEYNDRHYLIVDAVDGRSHYIDIGKAEATDFVPISAVVRIAPKSIEARGVDRTVARVAAANGGRYSIDLHLAHDPTARQTFAETHVRRLEAMRKATGSVEREADGTWIVASDHIERAAAFEAQRARAAPVVVEMLSPIAIERQVGTDGATWLDRELIADRAEPLRDAGFGRDVREALARRRQWLIEQDLAREEQGRIIYRANLLVVLRRRELNRVAGRFADELGIPYAEARSGERIEGIYRRPVELASGRYALIEKSREFTLVPWRPVLDRHVERQVSGIMRGDATNWTIGRRRSGPSIS